MDVFLIDWLNLLFRWGHIIAGVGWIGTSFYFIALDLSLRKRAGQGEGIMGSAWLVHGGGFYNVEKYTVAPDDLPEDLVWYKWEAYLTWVTGFALLILQYYLNARAYLIDPSVMDLTPLQAVGISMASLAVGWTAYTFLCRFMLGRSTAVLALIVFIGSVAAAWGYGQVFSGRGALIHVGALLGTIMAANVFMVIIPNQKKITASLLAGDAPDPTLGQIGKQRSVHNNYLTLPVLLMMVSNHYAFVTGHPQAWLLVAFIIVLGASVRHLLNRHEAGDPLRAYSWTLPVSAVCLIVAIALTAPQPVATDRTASGQVSDSRVLAITATHCATCHAAEPSHEFFDAAPKDVHLETTADLLRYADLVRAQAVQSNVMPLGNETGMTNAERAELGAWLAQNRGAR